MITIVIHNSKLFERSYHQYAIIMALQQFGVIPLRLKL